ncbi:MAG: ABC transporter substrate binding protein, partial [Thermodesulfobacteriota bacterium]|nr:ABC transporter substrate binding protein [Thermodesulfobacteriota bacterium]
MFLFILFLCCSTAQTAELPRVFIVHSYEPDNFTSKPQDNGLVKGFAEHGFVDGATVTIERFFMDTKRTYTTPEQVQARGREALARIRDLKPDLVITVDDNAARTVMLSLVDSDVPVVFTGINVKPEVYNRGTKFMASRQHPGHNVTGVYEKLYIEKSVQAMKDIIPDLKKIIFIVDSSLTGNAIRQQIESELLAGNSGILYTIRQVSSFDEYKHLIRWINADPETGAYYPMAIRLAAEDGSIVQTSEIMRWTLGHVRKPAMSINYRICKLGSFGGVSVDFTAMGRQAGQKGALILKGQPAGEISIEDAAEYALVFNIARAKQLGVVIAPELLGAADQVYDTMGFAVTPQPFHILIVHSNEKGLGTGTDIEKEVLAELGRNDFVEGNNLKISRFYMQTRRTYRTPEQIYRRGQDALEKVKQLKPDLVIILEDVAAKEVMLPLVDSAYPVLFGGISLSPENYNGTRKFMTSRIHPGHNVSGVTGEYQYEKSLQAVQLAFPEARNVVLITNKGSFWQ